MTNETMDKVRNILLKARDLGMHPDNSDQWIEELMWEILLLDMPSEDPSRDDLMVVAELTDAESDAAALAWVEAREQIDDLDAYEHRGFAWRQVL